MPIICPFKVTLPPPKPLHEMILERFDQYGDDLSLEEDGSEEVPVKMTFKQIRVLAINVANNLFKHGFKKGDVMAVYLENRIHFVPLLLAVSALGGAVTGVNPLYTIEELRRQLSDSGSKYVFTKKSLLKKVKEACVGLPVQKIILVDGPATDGCISMLDLYKGYWYPDFPRVSIDVKEDVVILPYSSGTTGLPKGVMLTHLNLSMLSFSKHALGAFRVSKREQVTILFMPFFHMAGFMALIGPLANGSKAVIMTKFDPIRYVALTAMHKATVIFCVPSLLVFLTKSKEVEKYDLSSINTISFGAAPAGKELIEGVKRKFPNVTMIQQGYGMTESGGISTANPALPASQYVLGSCGTPVPGTEIKVVSVDGLNKELGPMQTGEIWIRSPAVMKGYINNEKATKETIDADGWLHSGDLGYYDYFAHVYVVDRLKELIKYKGFQVAPAELEDLILKHPAIQEIAVVGHLDPAEPDIGELPTAYVVLKQGHKASAQLENSIKQLVAEHLAPYKHLRGGVKFCHELPKGPSGKIMKRDIRIGKVKLLESHHWSKI